jgi:hypothetical protein
MAPVVRTSAGFILFEEYMATLLELKKVNRKYAGAYSRSPESSSKSSSKDIETHPPSPVVCITNFPQDKLDHSLLFKFCGAFGDVCRIKISQHMSSVAFVQMVNTTDAAMVVKHLSGLSLWDHELHVKFAKARHLTAESKNSGIVDFSSSPFHRFGKRNNKNRNNICAVNNVLHVSSLPEDYTEAQLKVFLGEDRIKTISPMANKKMALVVCHSKEDAVEALAENHNREFKHKFIRVSFSKC